MMFSSLQRTTRVALAVTTLVAASCARPERPEPARAPGAAPAGTLYVVRDTIVTATLDASAVAEPIRRATLGTKLMGTVTAVMVAEGDAVTAGQPLARIDARDLAARQAQVAATIAEAEAVHGDAAVQAGRIRALFADSAATRVQLDAAETGLMRADAAVRAARAGAEELGAVREYAAVRAPFDGIVTQRLVDPGAFVAPGTPIVTVEDVSRLRVRANVTPRAASTLRRGAHVAITIEGAAVEGVVEGVVPTSVGNLYVVNALVENRHGSLLAGSAATLSMLLGTRAALVVPASALRREGELTGVTIRTASGDETRWVRVARTFGDRVEIGAGLRVGDRVVVPGGEFLTAPVAAKER